MSSFNSQAFVSVLYNTELIGAGAARSLELLRDIDGTISALSHHAELMGNAAASFEETAKKIANCSEATAIAEETLIPVLENLQDALKAAHLVMIRKRDAAIQDPRLNEDDGVVEAYERFLDAMCHLNETTEKLRWFVMENNADAEDSHTPEILSDNKAIDDFLDSL